MKLHKLILTAVAGSLLLASCSSDDDNKASGAYDNGVLILNQGGFGKGNASVSFLAENNTVENKIYSNVNGGAVLGDTGQDIGLVGDLAYIVLNVSNKIEIVNRYTFAKVGVITEGLTNPRYIVFEDGKAYVTCWGDGSVATDDYVAVIDLASNKVSSTIPVAEGPEKIVEENGKLYVAHAGGYNFGNTISVINAASKTVATTITVGDIPNSLEIENGNLYVISGGLPSWTEAETAGQLDVISLSSNTVTKSIDFATEAHPSNLAIESNNIFYTVGDEVYTMPITASALPTASLLNIEDNDIYGIYSFAVEDGYIYVGSASDFKTDDKVLKYSVSGTLFGIFTVGIAPAGFYFND